jgi:hypothetical protein
MGCTDRLPCERIDEVRLPFSIRKEQQSLTRPFYRQVHLHVISSDLISPKLKNKKYARFLRFEDFSLTASSGRHYNSFHPKLGFFLHLEDVLEQVEAGVVDTVCSFFCRSR